ncbi:MAG: hypothetical protein ABW252_13160 [Polyangiales bacterium]
MNRHHSLLRSTILTLSLLAASAAAADDASSEKPKAAAGEKSEKPKSEKGPTVSGKYKYAGPKSEKEVIKKQVDEIVWKADESIRVMAQETLNKRTHVPEWWEVKQAGNKITVHAEGRTVEKHDLSKESTDGLDQDGNPCALKVAKQGSDITQWIVTTDGTRKNVFRPQPDGTLKVDVEISSPRLPAPITYTLTYKK